jgi:hypothetical protein
MVKDHRFWVGFVVGIIAYFVYMNYVGRKTKGA